MYGYEPYNVKNKEGVTKCYNANAFQTSSCDNANSPLSSVTSNFLTMRKCEHFHIFEKCEIANPSPNIAQNVNLPFSYFLALFNAQTLRFQTGKIRDQNWENKSVPKLVFPELET